MTSTDAYEVDQPEFTQAPDQRAPTALLGRAPRGERVAEHESLSLFAVSMPETPDHGSREIRLDVRR